MVENEAVIAACEYRCNGDDVADVLLSTQKFGVSPDAEMWCIPHVYSVRQLHFPLEQILGSGATEIELLKLVHESLY